MARLEKYTPAQVIEALRQSAGIRMAAAKKLGVSPQTIRNYIDRHPEIGEALIQIEEDNLDLAETKLLMHLKDGDRQSVFFYLKTKGRRRGYVEGRELSGPEGGAIKTEPSIDAAKLTIKERKQLLALHAKATASVETVRG